MRIIRRSKTHLHIRGKHLLLGSIPEFQEDLFAKLIEIGHQAKTTEAGIASVRLGPAIGIVTTKDTHLRKSSREEFSRSAAFPLENFIGMNSFSAHGQAWVDRHEIEKHHLMSKNTVQKLIENINTVISANTNQLSNITDINDWLHKLVMKIVLSSLYGVPFEKINSLTEKLEPFLKSITKEIISLPNMAKRRTPFLIRKVLYPEICAPEQVKKRVDDFLKEHFIPHIPKDADTLMNAYIAKFGLDNALGDLFGMLFASVDTSASSIAFLLYELSRNPSIQNKLQSKTDEDFQIYLDAVIKEIFLLYPAFPFEIRGVVKPFMMEGFPMKKGDTCFMLNPALLENYHFNPERWFQKDALKNFPIHAFGVGPRACTGQVFATYVMKLVTKHLLTNYHIDCASTGDNKTTLNDGGSLKFARPIAMRFTCRKHSDAVALV